MKKLIAALTAVLMLVSCAGQSKQVIVATTANAILPGLVKVYKADAHDCVEKSSTRPEATECLRVVDKRWDVIWTGWDGLRAADDATTAWCGFVKTMKDAKLDVPTLVDVPCQ